jgi:hypothetical protein
MNPFKDFSVYCTDNYSNQKKISWRTQIYYETEEERREKRQAKIEQFKKVIEALYGECSRIEISETSEITFRATVDKPLPTPYTPTE